VRRKPLERADLGTRSVCVPEKTSDARAFVSLRIRKPVSERELARVDAARPRTRGDCRGGLRPCPFVGCRYALYLDVTRVGALMLNFPDVEPWDLVESCSLDIAERGEHTLEQVGGHLNLIRERVRQVEAIAIEKLFSRMEAA
jgi:hypothetical protein